MRLLILALVLPTPTPAHAQFVLGNGPGVEQAIHAYARELSAAVPSAVPSSVQTDAPSVNPASPALLDRAEAPRPFALAFDRPLDDVDRGLAGTLRFDPLALAEGRGLNASGAPPRLGASVTLGGPTQIADSTRALRHAGIADHVTTELKLRLLGRRERGDDRERFPSAMNLPAAEAQRALLRTPEFRDATARDPGERGRYDGFLAALRSHPDLARALLDHLSKRGEAMRALDDRVDRSFVLSLSLAADTYATGFGRDLWAATLIAEMPRPFNLTANVGYRPEEEVHENRNQELKLAVGTSWRWFAGSRLLGPVDATLSGGELVRDHGRPNVSLLNSKVELPRSNGMRLIASMTCSNHPERMGEGVVRGSLGVSYGLPR